MMRHNKPGKVVMGLMTKVEKVLCKPVLPSTCVLDLCLDSSWYYRIPYIETE